MSRTPAWLAEVFAQDEANRAAVRESERRRALVTKRFDGCIHKTNENALVRKAAEPVQPSGTMSAAEQEPWDTWCDRRADERIFALFKPGAPMGDVIAEVISLLRCELRKEFTEQLGQLRAEMNVLTGIQRGELKQLIRDSDVPVRRRDAN